MYEFIDRRYALALYEVAEDKGKVDEYLEQFGEVVKVIFESEDLITFIKHPQLSTSKKKELIKSIFGGKVEEGILSFLLILLEKGRILAVKEIEDELKRIYLEKHETVIAVVKTVIPLKEQEKVSLIEKLSKKYNKTILLNEEIDKELIGGVYVRVGNDVIDGTIKTKLQEMKKLALKVE